MNSVLNPETGCLIWTGTLNHDGYGLIWMFEQQYQCLVHRVTYELVHGAGSIPDDKETDHLCRNHACFEITHLEIVPHAINMQRSVRAKLTPDEVREIRAIQGLTQRTIAEMYGISQQQVSGIRRRAFWSNIA